jgi:Pectate lyase superfamily protein
MKKLLFIASLCLTAFGANAQSVRQSGSITPGHIASWAAPGVIVDGGVAGGNVVTGTIVANDFVCTTAGGVPFDCGGGFGTNNVWTGTNQFSSTIVQALTQFHFLIGNSGGQTADTALSGDCTYGASGIICTKTNGVAFVAVATSGSSNDVTYTASGTGATSRTDKSKLSDITSILDYGAVGDGATDNTTAIQNAINAVTTGGVVLVPGFNYNITGTLTISKPLVFWCTDFQNSSGGNLNATTTTADLIRINASNVVIRDCYLNRTGTPTTGKGIAVGTDGRTVTDGAITNTQTTFTSATAAFTSADVGKRIRVNGAGAAGVALFATITVFTNSTTVTVTPAASTTVTGATTLIAPVYTDILLDNVQGVNHNIGVHFINAARFHMRDNYYLSTGTGAEGARVEDQVSPDFGDSWITASHFQSTDTSTGYGLHYMSSGGLKMTIPKFLGGKYGLFLDWNVGLSGQLSLTGGSIETCGTSAIFATAAFQFNGFEVQGVHITCGAPNIVLDNAGAATIVGGVIASNQFNGGGGTSVDLGKASDVAVVGNLMNTGGGNPAITVRSNCAACSISGNNIVGSTLTLTSASATTKIDDTNGMTTANLPTSAANGSRIFATDADPATACTHAGAQTGSTAFRQNAAWKCF